MTGARIALPLGLAVALAIAALAVVPRAFEADSLLSEQDDPVALADRAIARSFDAAVAVREINAALAANDADLAHSFLELARDQKVPVEPALAEKVELAYADAASAARSLESFTRGLITGEPDDLIGFAGTAVGDLFVFGDIRDAVREGTRLASGQEADQLILGLACVGLAVTAGTYATVGVGAPARVGLTVVKAARKTGRISSRMATWIGRSLREIVDWTALRRAIGGAKVTEPAGNARRPRRSQARPGAARHVQDRPACRHQGRQDPRDPQGRRPQRHPADHGCVQPRDVDILGAPHGVRLRVVAQAHDRADHRALLCAPQAAPRTRA